MREKLKVLRLAAGLTALQLAQLAGTTESRIYAFERGRNRPHIQEGISIATALHVSPVEIFPDMANEFMHR